MLNQCPCGLAKPYSDCCGLYISKASTAPSPELLMRSRYTAYATSQIDYILNTMRGSPLVGFSIDEALSWSQSATWIRLEVVDAPLPRCDVAYVEFRAYYSISGVEECLHERSCFKFLEGRWFYVGQAASKEVNLKAPGRNDLCPCGSGRKFKKCCLR